MDVFQHTQHPINAMLGVQKCELLPPELLRFAQVRPHFASKAAALQAPRAHTSSGMEHSRKSLIK